MYIGILMPDKMYFNLKLVNRLRVELYTHLKNLANPNALFHKRNTDLKQKIYPNTVIIHKQAICK